MNPLIERIERYLRHTKEHWTFKTNIMLLEDCKAEIERLLLANETLFSLCDDYQAQIKQAKEYTPITKREWVQLHASCASISDWANSDSGKASGIDFRESQVFGYSRMLEAEVIKRANLVVKEKE